jgi:hypothetical protein
MNQVEQRSVIRFEKRGRELDAVARLTRVSRGSRRETKKTAAAFRLSGSSC